MINQIRISRRLFIFLAICFPHPVRGGDCLGICRGWGERTLNSSGSLESDHELLDENVTDDGGEEDPKTVGDDPVDDQRVPVVVTCLAPATAVVLQSHP